MPRAAYRATLAEPAPRSTADGRHGGECGRRPMRWSRAGAGRGGVQVTAPVPKCDREAPAAAAYADEVLDDLRDEGAQRRKMVG